MCIRDRSSSWHFPPSELLVVDDALENRELLKLLLEDLGLDVTLAEDGLQAVNAVKDKSFDLVLMDIQMPVMDGYEAVAEMRKIGFDRPIVALTANAMKGYELRILEAGFSHYQTKPIDIDKLTNLLSTLLGGEIVAALSEPDKTSKVPAQVELTPDSSAEQPIYSTLAVSSPRFVAIIQSFLEKLDNQIIVMHDTLNSEDWTQLFALGHWLKGSGGTCGFEATFDPAFALEEAAKAKDKQAAVQAIADIERIRPRLMLSLIHI